MSDYIDIAAAAIQERDELLIIMRRALRLSREHREFCLWAMEPFVDACEPPPHPKGGG